MKAVLLILHILLFVLLFSINGIAIDDFHCKVPTCRDFYFGLKHFPRRKEYEKICFETVFALQAIPRKHGKCISDEGTINAPCIHALADTIKNCISQLHDLSDHQARYYCGYTLMKYCAVHLGLDGYPLKFDA